MWAAAMLRWFLYGRLNSWNFCAHAYVVPPRWSVYLILAVLFAPVYDSLLEDPGIIRQME